PRPAQDATHVFEYWIAEAQVRYALALTSKLEQLVRRVDGQGAQSYRVDHREYGAVCSDTQSERNDSDNGEAGILQEDARAVSKVFNQVPQQTRLPRAAHFLFHLSNAAELERCFSLRLIFREAGPRQVIDASVDVVLQFAVEVLFLTASPGKHLQDLSHRSLTFVEDQTDRIGEPVPAAFLDRELLAACRRERIELCLAPRFRLPPFGSQPALFFEPVQSRIQRTLVDLNCLARNDLKLLCDAVSMRGIRRQDSEDQHVESALRDRKACRRHRTSTSDI